MLYKYTCYVVIIYLRDSDQFIEKKNSKTTKLMLKLSQMLWSTFPGTVCLAQVVRANKKSGLITM